jgi:hypothetical protein
MKNSNTQIRTLTILMAVAAVVVGTLNPFTGGTAAHTIAPNDELPGFGLVTVAPGEGLRLSVVNTSVVEPTLPPNPCRVRITFVDASGNVVGEPQTETLAPGESISTFADFGGRVSIAQLLRPIVEISDPRRGSDNHLPPNPCVPTAEVFDTETSRTSLLIDGAGRAKSLKTLNIVEETH